MFLTIILILLILYLVMRLLFATVFRVLFGWTRGKNQRKKQNVAYKKGKTTIISPGKQHSDVPKELGDYTEFEEV
jgi:hypothetical protein